MNKSTVVNEFFTYMQDLFEKIATTQQDKFDEAAQVMAECLRDEKQGRRLHIWGTGGHSAMIAEDALYRKGGFANINPILDPGLSLAHGALKTIPGLMGVPGYAKAILEYRKVKKDDVLLIGMSIGANVTTIEAALEAKKKGLTVIAITSPTMSRSVDVNHPSRHETKKNLYEVVDIYIDDFVPPGDAVIKLEGFEQKVAPIATIAVSAVYQALVALTCEKLLAMGVKPKIWTNALSMGGVEANQAYIKEYYGQFKDL